MYPKPWSVAQFENERPELVRFLKMKIVPLIDSEQCQRILIRAPVKSGKREMVEYLSVRDQTTIQQHRVHAFITAFHRVADKDQRKELKHHNMDVFSLTSAKNVEDCLSWIHEQLVHSHIVIHIDECDFGTADYQNLSKVYGDIRDCANITVILYSATPQEVLFSEEIEKQDMIRDITKGVCVDYTPPAVFCGPRRFLEENLVHEAQPFFRKKENHLELTNQGREIMTNLRDSIAQRTGRNILVLRLSYSDLGGDKNQRKENKAIYQFLYGWQTIPEIRDCIIYVDKSENELSGFRDVNRQKIEWSQIRYWRGITRDEPIIVVIDQTSSRSTEWVCHDRVFAYHDFRNTIVFNTISQAQERVNHYSTKYNGFQPIKVYGHLKTFQLSAGKIEYKDYLNYEWEVRKVDRRISETDAYQIRNSHDRTLHPLYNQHYTKSETDQILQKLGCFVDIKLSARLKGTIQEKSVYDIEFIPCTPDTFTQIFSNLNLDRNFQNPFVRSERKGLVNGKYQGYLRGWQVLDYDHDVKTNVGWGVQEGSRITICYRNGILGVARRYDTGDKQKVETLQTHGSMYH